VTTLRGCIGRDVAFKLMAQATPFSDDEYRGYARSTGEELMTTLDGVEDRLLGRLRRALGTNARQPPVPGVWPYKWPTRRRCAIQQMGLTGADARLRSTVRREGAYPGDKLPVVDDPWRTLADWVADKTAGHGLCRTSAAWAGGVS
jgi:hypothetical protein